MASEQPQDPQSPQVQLEGRWVDVDEVPILLANQLVAQVFQGHIQLTFGQVGIPPLTGSPEEQAAQANQLEFLPIRTVARFSVPAAPFREMAQTLRSVADALDASESNAAHGQESPE